MCMNDFMEVQYGLHRLYKAYHESEAGKRFKSFMDDLFDGFRTEIEKLFDSCTQHLRTDTYITCLSEHKAEEDTLGRLSMWRAYGGATGVALVMKTAPFEATEPSDVLKIYGSPVAYYDDKKFSAEFAEIVNNIDNESDFIKQRDRNEIKERILRMLAYGAVCTKHPGFEEELEWRIIHFPWWEKSVHLIKEIEVIQGAPQTVFKIPLEDIPKEGLFGITIPALIDRIIIGPNRDPLAMKLAFIDLLDKAGAEQPGKKVFVSDVPLRQ